MYNYTESCKSQGHVKVMQKEHEKSVENMENMESMESENSK